MSNEVFYSSLNQSGNSQYDNERILLADAFNVIDNNTIEDMAGEEFWSDFLVFMQSMYPNVTAICNVTARHADDYINHLVQYGKYSNKINLQQDGKISYYENTGSTLSLDTINEYLSAIKNVFNTFCEKGFLSYNPFEHISKLDFVEDQRAPFSCDELQMIFKNADEAEDPNFIMGLFTIGLYTGLTERDICLLRWSEIDLNTQIIKLRSRTNHREIIIPIMPPLKIYLECLRDEMVNSEYVLPAHAQIFKTDAELIGHAVEKYLRSIGICTSVPHETEPDTIVKKDIHSLRYSFCTYAGTHNIPLAVVMSILGHMSPAMTEHYKMNCDTHTIAEKLDEIDKKHTLKLSQTIEIDHSHETEVIDFKVDREGVKQRIDQLSDEKVIRVMEFIDQL
ncbi:tyrosine-type recombinase/integrase [Lentisphaerota bacterium WC36G]|nr:site-specific integrase [Lentisphaerae bacterium WC36]